MKPQDHIDTIHEAYKFYHDKKDRLITTHSLVDTPNSLFGLHELAIEIPTEKIKPIVNLMMKEVNAADRISMTDGKFQLECEIWDDDYSKRLYHCVDISIKQLIKLIKMKKPAMGYVEIGNPSQTVGAQKIFSQDDFKSVLRVKMQIDAQPNIPKTWKRG